MHATVARRLAPLIAVATCLLAAPTAHAATATPATATSVNWAGYAVSASGVRFKRVSAAWKAPAVDCSDGRDRWSANWVGLGGNAATSAALEQIGTEADCRGGVPSYTSWYELVPDVSHSARLKILPGDLVTASVTVSGHSVRLRMADDTTGKVFAKTLHPSAVDLSSAEWIVEAPSACAGAPQAYCRIMPLADFGTSSFAAAHAETAAGHTGTIADPAWNATQISLSSEVRRFDGPGAGFDRAPVSEGAQAGPLDASGTAFSVTWGATG